MKPVIIIIPTYNNIQMLMSCIMSIVKNTIGYYKIIIVNNGSEPLDRYITGVTIFKPETNLGWSGGINYAIKNMKELGIECDYILLMNDDTLITPGDYDWIENLKMIMDKDDKVAAVGPSSNVVAGLQNIGHMEIPTMLSTKYLIGFCVLIRKKLFDEIGGCDESLPFGGGDDMDWSIQFRLKGYKLIARRDVFVYHHGFQTGARIHGDNWNSPKFVEEINTALIRKHGFKNFIETIKNHAEPYDTSYEEYGDNGVLLKIVNGRGIDVGCGPNKITPDTIGVDLTAKGDKGVAGGVTGMTSVADIQASGDNLHMFKDSELDYVVARHNLEHYPNTIKTLREWNRVLKVSGKLGMTFPDDSKLNGMRLDPTHKHSFSREAMMELLKIAGFEVDEIGGCANGWDFYVICHKKIHSIGHKI